PAAHTPPDGRRAPPPPCPPPRARGRHRPQHRLGHPPARRRPHGDRRGLVHRQTLPRHGRILGLAQGPARHRRHHLPRSAYRRLTSRLTHTVYQRHFAPKLGLDPLQVRHAFGPPSRVQQSTNRS